MFGSVDRKSARAGPCRHRAPFPRQTSPYRWSASLFPVPCRLLPSDFDIDSRGRVISAPGAEPGRRSGSRGTLAAPSSSPLMDEKQALCRGCSGAGLPGTRLTRATMRLLARLTSTDWSPDIWTALNSGPNRRKISGPIWRRGIETDGGKTNTPTSTQRRFSTPGSAALSGSTILRRNNSGAP